MDKVCPICNGMAQINVKCPCCGQDMQDGGRSKITSDHIVLISAVKWRRMLKSPIVFIC